MSETFSLLWPIRGYGAYGVSPKTDYQWKLAQKLFKKHEKYKDVFATVQTAADMTTWQRKIKNHLKR
jgi:hypothetical protein